MTKRKIIYIGGFELPDKNAAAIRVMENAKAISSLNKTVVFIGITKNEDKIKKDDSYESYAIKYPSNIFEWIRYIFGAKNIVSIIKNQKNVEGVILYNYPSFSMKKIMNYCKKNSIKVYGDITEWYIPEKKNLLFRIIKKIDVNYRMKYLNNELDGMILISKYLMGYYAKHKNIIYVPVLTDIENPKWINNFKKDKNVMRLVYAGNIENKDNINIIIEALEFVNRKYVFDIIGINKEDFLKKFPYLKEKIDKNDKIVFHGRLANSATLEYIKKANYTIFFREKNIMTLAGFPSKLVESLSCGTPVITNSSSNIEDYFINNTNGFCLKKVDISEIVNLIENIDYEMNTEVDAFDYRKYINVFESMLNK